MPDNDQFDRDEFDKITKRIRDQTARFEKRIAWWGSVFRISALIWSAYIAAHFIVKYW